MAYIATAFVWTEGQWLVFSGDIKYTLHLIIYKNLCLPEQYSWQIGNTFETALTPSRDTAEGHVYIIHLEGKRCLLSFQDLHTETFQVVT